MVGGLTHLPRGQPHAGEPCGEACLLRVWRRLRGGGFNLYLGPTLVRNGSMRLGTPEGCLLCAILRWHILALCAAEPSPQVLLVLLRPLYTWERGTQRLTHVSRVPQGHGRVRGEAIDPWNTPPCFPTPLLTLTPPGSPSPGQAVILIKPQGLPGPASHSPTCPPCLLLTSKGPCSSLALSLEQHPHVHSGKGRE